MNRTEKNLQTKRKIMDSAILEFGSKNYAEASMNSICNTGNISKGIIYHYFKDKDELYLVCVEECFDKLINFMNREDNDIYDFEQDIKKFIELRNQFFCDYPNYRNLFFYAILQPPKHLTKKIRELKTNFDAFNIAYCKSALESVTLKDNITKEEALEYFLIYQEAYNAYFQNQIDDGFDFNSVITDHEIKLTKMLKIMLYGIAKEETKL